MVDKHGQCFTWQQILLGEFTQCDEKSWRQFADRHFFGCSLQGPVPPAVLITAASHLFAVLQILNLWNHSKTFLTSDFGTLMWHFTKICTGTENREQNTYYFVCLISLLHHTWSHWLIVDQIADMRSKSVFEDDGRQSGKARFSRGPACMYQVYLIYSSKSCTRCKL